MRALTLFCLCLSLTLWGVPSAYADLPEHQDKHKDGENGPGGGSDGSGGNHQPKAPEEDEGTGLPNRDPFDQEKDPGGGSDGSGGNQKDEEHEGPEKDTKQKHGHRHSKILKPYGEMEKAGGDGAGGDMDAQKKAKGE